MSSERRDGMTVGNVMTAKVLAVAPDTDFRKIATIFRENRVSACPVVNGAGQVLGVVSEADLLHKAAETDFPAGPIRLQWKLSQKSKATAVTADQLMTSPAVTIHADAPVTVAAKTMQDRRLKRLPVVDEEDKLIGIVSRVDVLSVYERPDSAIQADIQRLISDEFGLTSERIAVTATAGIVTLTGSVPSREMALTLVAQTRNVDGVVATRDRLTISDALPRRQQGAPAGPGTRASPRLRVRARPGGAGEPPRHRTRRQSTPAAARMV